MTNSMNTPSTSARRSFAALDRAARRVWRDCRGSIIVEFALLTPVLLAIFFAIIQFGFIMFTRQEMLYAAREAARSYSVGLNDATATRQLALDLLAVDNKTGATFAVTVIEPGDTGGGGGDTGNSGDGGNGSGKQTEAGVTGDVTVIITVPMAEAALVSFLEENILSGDIEVSATMFVQGVPEVLKGSSTGEGKATAKSGSGNGTSEDSDASFHDYITGGNRFA